MCGQVNNIASRWSGKKGPTPPTPAQKRSNNWGGNAEFAVGVEDFVDWARFDFRPKNSSHRLLGGGVLHPPQVLGPNPHPDIGAYQANAEPWSPGCTFSPQCAVAVPPPPPPPPPCALAGWQCARHSCTCSSCLRVSFREVSKKLLHADCGPKESFFWSGSLDAAACEAACAGNATGCACFDVLTGGPDGLEGAVAGAVDVGRRGLEEGQGGYAECRLHASAADIVTNAESRYTAYWRNTTAG